MTTLARKVLNANRHDNIVLDRLVARNPYQEIMPIGCDQLYETEECAYVFEDGSALINSSYNNWRVVTRYIQLPNPWLQDYL